MGEYQSKADRMDTLLGDGGGGGRVRRRLDLFGELITVVVGKHNELSEGGHMLLEAMASSRAALLERRTGMAHQDVKAEKGIIQGELRRQLSVVNLRASMSCMLDRLHQCTMRRLSNISRRNFYLTIYTLCSVRFVVSRHVGQLYFNNKSLEIYSGVTHQQSKKSKNLLFLRRGLGQLGEHSRGTKMMKENCKYFFMLHNET